MQIKEYSSVGYEVVGGGQSLLVSLSINNSYFSRENLEKLLVWASAHARSVYVMIPDEPAVHTLMALGKTKVDAERIARLNANALENKCRDIIRQFELGTIRIIRWKDIVSNDHYQSALAEVRACYEEDTLFRQAALSTTALVLKNNGIAIPDSTMIETGVVFLLKELAFITRAVSILKEEKTAYVYHHTLEIMKDILGGKYHFKADSAVGFITVE